MKANKLVFFLAFLGFGAVTLQARTETDPDSSALILNLSDKTTFQFGGAVWINYANQHWISPDMGRKRGLRFDNVRLSMDGTHGDHLLVSAQYRIYGYTRAVHHAWIGIKPNDNNQIEIGITQVPFGLLPFATHSFWFGLGYNLGMEDDYDAGVKWYRQGENIDIHLAGFYSEEYGDATNLNRYSTDLVRVGEQQNEEFAQGNIRLAYFIGRETDFQTEIGVSGQAGGIDNKGVDKNGFRWKAAIHYAGHYKSWNPEFQIARYEFHPQNPDSVDNRLILLGNLTSKRLVAAKGTVINANLRRFWEVNWGPIKGFNAYFNYSMVLKDEPTFKTSYLNNPGCVFQAGPLWLWVDLLVGRNAWYLNDSEENSGPGPGGTDKWETRFNMSLEWYF